MKYFTSFNAFTLNDVKLKVNSFAKMVIINRYAAIEMVLRYRRHSIDKKLAPSTINVRLAAIKSLVDMGRKMGKTTIDLTDIDSIKS